MLTIRDLVPWGRRHLEPSGRRGFEHPMLALQHDMERMFDDVWRGFDAPLPGWFDREHAVVAPRIDISEDDARFVVTAEVPGIEEKDVEILLGDDTLTIKGEKKSEHEGEEQGVRRMERTYGSFRRTIAIDTPILADKVEATFKNGVLTVTLPKDPDAQSHLRRIPVSGGPALESPEAAQEKAA